MVISIIHTKQFFYFYFSDNSERTFGNNKEQSSWLLTKCFLVYIKKKSDYGITLLSYKIGNRLFVF